MSEAVTRPEMRRRTYVKPLKVVSNAKSSRAWPVCWIPH
jgi:hypothetical protein